MHLYFSTVIAFAALPFLVDAVPVSSNSFRAKSPISLPLTKYSNHLNGDGHVDPRRVQAGVDQTRAKYDRAFNEHERRTGEIHPLALKRRHSNERRNPSLPEPVDLQVFSNALWTIDVAVGSPAIGYSVQVDTLTSDMFLGGFSCLSCFDHKRYNGSLGSAVLNQAQGTFNFSLGPITGSTVSDQVSLLNGDFRVLQPIIVATKIGVPYELNLSGSNFTSFPADGAMGFGMNKQSWFGQLINEKQLPDGHQVFGMSLSGSPQLIIGGTNNTKFQGKLTSTVKVVKNAIFWQIPLEAVIVNGTNIKITNTDAIIDSGSTVVAGDPGDIANLHKNIPGSAQIPNSDLWTVPCNTTVTVIFTFGGHGFKIPPNAYILGPISSNGIDVQPIDIQRGICMSGFTSSGNDGMWTVGTVFMQTVYTQYDLQHFEIGFGKPMGA